MRTHSSKLSTLAGVFAILFSTLSPGTSQETMMEVGMTGDVEITRPADGDWARAKVEAMEGIKNLKAGQRKLLQKLKSDPEFAAEYSREIESNLTKIKATPDPVEPVVDQREHGNDIELIRAAARKIDEIIRIKLESVGKGFNPPVSDEHFLRRIYLQAAGRIPTREEALAFYDDDSPTKREALIDDLLLRPDYRMQMFNYLSDMLRIKKMHPLQGDSAGYELWVMKQLATNRPWNEIVYELLSAKGTMITNPATGWMVRDRGMDLDRLANTMTTFMGAAVGCAQCHDHPIEDWTQKEFYELTSFFGSLEIPAYGGKPFGSSRESKTTAAASIAYVVDNVDRQLTYPEDWAYDDAEPGALVTPKFPIYDFLVEGEDISDPAHRQEVFAKWMTHTGNGQFAATMANRLWKKAFGSGVIEPVTEMDDIAMASNSDLMRYLTRMMQQIGFDLMAFQRVVYNTQAFQSQSSLSPPQGERYQFSGPILQRMTAEQTWDSFITLRHGAEVNEHVSPRHLEARQYDVFQPGALVDLKFPGTPDNKATYEPLLAEAAQIRLKHKGEWMKALKGLDQLRRASELPLPTPESHFLRQFGQSAKLMADDGSREGTIPQALLMMNGQELEKGVLSNPKSHFYQIASEAGNAEAQVDSLYLSFLGRHATDEEKGVIAEHDLPIEEIAWILANTREFIFVQ